MSASDDIQQAITALLPTNRYFVHEGVPTTTPHLRVPAPIVPRRKHDLANAIATASKDKGLCLFVWPPLPRRVSPGVPFVFVEEAEVRIGVVERPPTNSTGADAWDIADDVMTALQWQPHRGIQEAVEATMLAESCSQEEATALVVADPAFAPLVDLARVLAHPLQLSPRPTDDMHEPAFRNIDVLFTATFQLNPATPTP
jgi:hypothetical protein